MKLRKDKGMKLKIDSGNLHKLHLIFVTAKSRKSRSFCLNEQKLDRDMETGIRRYKKLKKDILLIIKCPFFLVVLQLR